MSDYNYIHLKSSCSSGASEAESPIEFEEFEAEVNMSYKEEPDAILEQHYEQKAQWASPTSTTIHLTPWSGDSLQQDHILVRVDNPGASWPNMISASQLDPFLTLPIQVDEVTNQLLHFYAKSYWQTAYGLSSKAKPSMKGTWERLAGVCVSHFHILMARSALHQLLLNGYASPTARKRLEFGALKHQNEAVKILRRKISLGPKADRKEILTSVISLATFEQRYGNRAKALLHFKAARDIFRELGVQNGADDWLREQQALWFEGIYQDPEASFIWGEEDAHDRMCWLKELLMDVDRVWRNRQLMPLKTRRPFVQQQTRFHEFLSRHTEGKVISFYSDIHEAVAQQRCLLIFVSIITALYCQTVEGRHPTTGSDTKAATGAIQIYSEWIEDTLIEQDLNEKQAEADLLWIMIQDFRDTAPRSANSAALNALNRLNFRDLHWRACGIANVVKYLPPNWQSKLNSWLLAFIEGKRYDGILSLNEYEFSYAFMGGSCQ